jgi:hypothetical protein
LRGVCTDSGEHPAGNGTEADYYTSLLIRTACYFKFISTGKENIYIILTGMNEFLYPLIFINTEIHARGRSGYITQKPVK